MCKNFSFLAGGESSEIFIFDVWLREVKCHFEVLSKKSFASDRRSDYLAFSVNCTLLSWLEPELCSLEDKMLAESRNLKWPLYLTSVVWRVLKVGVWGGLIWCNIYAEFQPNRKWSVSNGLNLTDLTWNGPHINFMFGIALGSTLNRQELTNYAPCKTLNNSRLRSLMVMPLQGNGDIQASCGTCKSSPIDRIFYEHTSSTNWNNIHIQAD